ncbi:hypothetical protein HY29_07215 [Hyphomonas beringensis]|uniref:Uncharacterized protein n=1 Tax=Hyphomonas beringensis TaxID=1280946 RepID=A0A062U300_9PROT|nr:hypothetical protein HY29_07215 [Hyphomonas beringensis]
MKAATSEIGSSVSAEYAHGATARLLVAVKNRLKQTRAVMFTPMFLPEFYGCHQMPLGI